MRLPLCCGVFEAWLQVKAVAHACLGTHGVSELEWASAADFLTQGEDLTGRPPEDWAEWSRQWLPLGKLAFEHLDAQLSPSGCPEGAVQAILQSLPELDQEAGDVGSLAVVKLLFHHLSGGLGHAQLLVSDATVSVWQQHWLLALASFVRFVYLKWVNIPQSDASLDSAEQLVAVPRTALERHHEFLFRHSVDDFVGSGAFGLRITENSVLFSEGFAFSSFCKLHEVDTVLESGVYKGASTELWLRTSGAQHIVAVDVFVPPEAKERLQDQHGVQLVTGDGARVLPQLLKKASLESRVAVFIDGPKGELAIRLALVLKEYPQVQFVAIHDMKPYKAELRRLGAFFFSDEPWFQNAYGHLDAPFHLRPDLEAGGTMAFLA